MSVLGMKTYLALLWGISVLFSMESMSASITASSGINPTAERNQTTEQMVTAPAVHRGTEMQPATWHPTQKHAEIRASPTAETAAPPSVKTEETVTTLSSDSFNGSTTGLVATPAATVSSSGRQLLHTSRAVTTGADVAPPSHNVTIITKSTEDQQSQTTSASSAKTSAASLATESSPQSTQTAIFIRNLGSPSGSTAFKMTTDPTPESAPASEPTSSPDTISDSSTSSTEHSSTSQTLSVTNSTSQFTDSGGSAASISTKSPSTTTATTISISPTGILSHEPKRLTIPTTTPTTASFHDTISEVSSSSTEHSSTSQILSVTRTPNSTPRFTDTGGSTASISTKSPGTTTAATISTSPTGILILEPKRLTVPTTTPTTTVLHEASERSPSTEVLPCSTRGVVKQCLIAVASLAGLATVFMVSTIILCTKLSARKYKVKTPQPATEMMCISALMPERYYSYTRQRNPVANGVLVIHGDGDSDEDGGDNLTVSSFLPENERYV